VNHSSYRVRPGGAQVALDADMDDPGELDFLEAFAPRGSPKPSPSLPHLSMHASKSQPEVITIDSDDSVGPEDARAPGKDEIWALFPNICPDYVTQLLATHRSDISVIISAILDQQEADGKYPTQPDPRHRSRKRKRSTEGNGSGLDLGGGDGDEDGIEDHSGDEVSDPDYVNAVQSKIARPDYAAIRVSKGYTTLAKELLSQEFPKVPLIDIRNQLSLHDGSVFKTYTAMDEQLRNADKTTAPWGEKKRPSKIKREFTPDQLPHLDMSTYKPEEQAALVEFSAARKLRAEKDGKIAAEAEERNNLTRARMQNQIAECGICFEDCAINRMVECQGEVIHRFCRSCMRSQAEAQIGMAKHQLTCMSTDGCSAGFSMAQKALFLDEKLTTALDRIETEEVLRMAGIENLETCPFCPNAAEYPPVEVDKEFHCDNPSCLQVSCRLCRRPTHIPKTCAEDEADRGLDARHTLEEAMSEALIRRCNKCENPAYSPPAKDPMLTVLQAAIHS
jgi:E3 ubiquitin-protein ligase RNF216